MHMRAKNIIAVAVAGIACASAYGFKTNYVDCTLADYTGHDGTSWTKAFKTIQEGVEAAVAGDLVLVAPGYYDEGGASIDDGENGIPLTNRVCITKRITVRSKEGRATRDSTFIVGRHATNPNDGKRLGMGLDAVRCVRFSYDENTHGAVLEGFTLINGATHYNSGKDSPCSIGGGAYFGSRTAGEETASYLVDCVVSNCVSTRGGGIYYGNAIRCRITGNYTSNNSPAVRDGNLYWCIVDGNYGSAVAAYLGGAKAVGCTIVNTPSDAWPALRGNNSTDKDPTRCLAFNTVVLNNAVKESTHISLTNCVVDSRCKYYAGTDSSTGYSTNRCMSVGSESIQFVSTATCDLRPLSSGNLADAGDAAHLVHVPERWRHLDYNGNPVPQSGAIAAGAIVKTETPRGGVVRFVSDYKNADKPAVAVNGYRNLVSMLYHVALVNAEPLDVECEMPTDPAKLPSRVLYGFSGIHDENSSSPSTMYYFPLRDTLKTYVLTPPSGLLQIQAHVTDNVIWANPYASSDAAADGSGDRPYRTLQAAVDAAYARQDLPGNERYFVIKAMKGAYGEGCAFYGGVSNRVAFTNDSFNVRLYAVDGPDETFIVGAEDRSTGHAYGYGSAAVRCVASGSGSSSVNGFTLCGGRVGLNAGSEKTGANCLFGGGIFARDKPFFSVEDCVITNCAGSRGSIAYGGCLRRCRVRDCVTTMVGALRGSVHASACVFERIVSDDIVGQDDYVYNCTMASDWSLGTCPAGTGNNTVNGMFNTILYGFKNIENLPNTELAGVFYGNVRNVHSQVPNLLGISAAGMKFADAENGDYSLYSACIPASKASETYPGGDFWRYAPAVDVNGARYAFNGNGPVVAGAFATSVPSILVSASASKGVASVSVSPEGDAFLAEGDDSVTFTANDAETRNFQGFYLNGELVTTAATFTYAHDGAYDGGRFEIEARYVPYWYVDPTKSDTNGGRSWADAKRTLEEVMKLALPGDTVYAESGTYGEGSMIQDVNCYDGTPLLRARVVLPAGVSLVSRRGPESTVIAGAAASEDVDGFGGGDDALRCVYMNADSRLEGFTLAGGRTSGKTEHDDNCRGAGVHGWKDNMPLVKDCVISNCVAGRAGGSLYVTAVNCRYFYNRATHSCGAALNTANHNCYFDYNYGGVSGYGGFIVGYWMDLRNCTIGAHNFTDTPLGPSPANSIGVIPNAYNVLVLKGKALQQSDIGFPSGVYSNCAFTASILPFSTNCIVDAATVFAIVERLQADENGVPLIGHNDAIDMGDARYLDARFASSDMDGNPRAVNGARMDIGCYEADWKARYSGDLGSRLSVSEASPAVYETDGRAVALVDGCKVAIDMSGDGVRVPRQTVSFRVYGDGVLTLAVDGETLSFADTGSVQTYQVRSASELRRFEFSFAGTGRAELLSAANCLGMSLVIR